MRSSRRGMQSFTRRSSEATVTPNRSAAALSRDVHDAETNLPHGFWAERDEQISRDAKELKIAINQYWESKASREPQSDDGLVDGTPTSTASSSYLRKPKDFKTNGAHLSTSNEKMKKLQNKLEHWEQRAAQAKMEIHNDTQEICPSKTAQQMNPELSELRANNKLWQSRAQEVQAKLDHSERDRMKLQEKVDKLLTKTDRANADQKNAVSLENKSRHWQERCLQKERMLADIRSRYIHLESKLEETNLRLTNIVRSPSVESNAEVVHLREQKDILQSKYDGVYNELSASRDQNRSLKANCDLFVDQKEHLERQLVASEKSLEVAEHGSAQMRFQLRDIMTELSDTKELVKELSGTDLTKGENSPRRLQDKFGRGVADSQMIAHSLESRAIQAETMNAESSAKLLKLENVNQELQERYKSLSVELASLKIQDVDMSQELDKRESAFQELERSLEILSKEKANELQSILQEKLQLAEAKISHMTDVHTAENNKTIEALRKELTLVQGRLRTTESSHKQQLEELQKSLVESYRKTEKMEELAQELEQSKNELEYELETIKEQHDEAEAVTTKIAVLEQKFTDESVAARQLAEKTQEELRQEFSQGVQQIERENTESKEAYEQELESFRQQNKNLTDEVIDLQHASHQQQLQHKQVVNKFQNEVRELEQARDAEKQRADMFEENCKSDRASCEKKFLKLSTAQDVLQKSIEDSVHQHQVDIHSLQNSLADKIAQLKDARTELEQRKEEMERIVEQGDHRIEQLQREKQKTDATIVEARAKVQKLSAEKEALVAGSAANTRELRDLRRLSLQGPTLKEDQLEHEVSMISKQNTDLERKLTDALITTKELDIDLTKILAEKSEIRDRFETVSQHKVELQAKLSAIEATKGGVETSLNNRIAKLESDLDEERKSFKECQGELSTANSKISELQQKSNHLQLDKERISTENAELEKRLASLSLESINNSLQSTLEAEKSRRTELQIEIGVANTRAQDFQAQLLLLTGSKDKLSEEVRVIERDYMDKLRLSDSTKAALESKCSVAHDALDQANSNVAKLELELAATVNKNEMKEVESQLWSTQSELANEKQKFIERVDEQNQIIEALQEQVTLGDSQREQWEGDIKERQAIIDNLTEDKRMLKDKIIALEHQREEMDQLYTQREEALKSAEQTCNANNIEYRNVKQDKVRTEEQLQRNRTELEQVLSELHIVQDNLRMANNNVNMLDNSCVEYIKDIEQLRKQCLHAESSLSHEKENKESWKKKTLELEKLHGDKDRVFEQLLFRLGLSARSSSSNTSIGPSPESTFTTNASSSNEPPNISKDHPKDSFAALQWEARAKEYEEDVDALSNELTRLRRFTTETESFYQQEKESLLSKIQFLEQSKDSCLTDRDNIRSREQELGSEIARLQSILHEKDAVVSNLSDTTTKLTDENKLQQDDLKSLRLENMDLASRLSDALARPPSTPKGDANEAPYLSGEIIKKQVGMDALKRELRVLESRADLAERSCVSKEQKLEVANNQLKELQVMLDKANADNAELTAAVKRIAELPDADFVQEKLLDYDNMVKELEQLRAREAKFRKSVSAQACQDEPTTYGALVAKYEASQRRVQELEDQVKTGIDRIQEEAVAVQEDMKKRCLELEQKLREQNSSCVTPIISKDVVALRKDVAVLQQESECLRAQLRILESHSFGTLGNECSVVAQQAIESFENCRDRLDDLVSFKLRPTSIRSSIEFPTTPVNNQVVAIKDHVTPGGVGYFNIGSPVDLGGTDDELDDNLDDDNDGNAVRQLEKALEQNTHLRTVLRSGEQDKVALERQVKEMEERMLEVLEQRKYWVSAEDFKNMVVTSQQSNADTQRLESIANDAVVERNRTEQLLAAISQNSGQEIPASTTEEWPVGRVRESNLELHVDSQRPEHAEAHLSKAISPCGPPPTKGEFMIGDGD